MKKIVVKKLAAIALIATAIFSGPAFATPASPVCTSGGLPKQFHGFYSATWTTSYFQIKSFQMYISTGGYFEVRSCMKDRKRVITLTDNNPESVQNFTVHVQSPGRDLKLVDLQSNKEFILHFRK